MAIFRVALFRVALFRVALVLALVAPAVLAGSPIDGSAKALIVQAGDLPATFAMSGGDELPSGGYGGLYFRPEVLMAPDLPAGDLLGVMTSVELAADPAQAELDFAVKSSASSIRSSIGGGGEVHELGSAKIETSVMGADDTALFRVDYELQGVRVIDYRYRLRVANAVANLIVSGRTGDGGTEPPDLRDQARSIAERQVARLLAARK